MENKIISLGINFSSLKTVYSISHKIDRQFITKVLLMNNESRVIPSLICYTSNHRLIGDNCKTSIGQNLNTSYNSFSRFLNFDKNNRNFDKEFNFMYLEEKEKNNFNFKCYNEKGEIINITSNFIIADYLSMINEYFFEKEEYKYTITSLSLPDFYNDDEKKELKLICEAIGMKNVKIFDESLAITMYYGYNNYYDFFKNEDNKKTILFIDIGYSKSLFILSEFKYDEFCVLNVLNIPHIGGRDFDLVLFNYCIKEFKKQNGEIEISDKMKYKLLVEIQKKRINLTVNDETLIQVDCFYNDIDLVIKIPKDKFEKLIKKQIQSIEDTLNQMIKYSKENEIKIDYVEIAGDLMRTPILLNMIEKQKLKIYKTILIDECTSIGASLLGNFYSGNSPIKDLKKVYIKRKKYKNYDNISFKDITFKEEIINHIQQQQIMDLKFDYFMMQKIELSKLINKIKAKYKNQNDELTEINKKLRNIDMNENDLEEIYNNLKGFLKKIKIKEFEKLIEEYENSIKNIKSNNETLIREIEFKYQKEHLLIDIEKKLCDNLKNSNTKEIELLKQILNILNEKIKDESNINIISEKLESLNGNLDENNKYNIQEIKKKIKELIDHKK